MRCEECGNKDLTMQSIKGTIWPYKDHRGLEFSVDYACLTCTECGNVVLSCKDIIKIDAVLEVIYQNSKVL